ncbi:MAG: hypothetical protein ACMUEL_01655 [Flavobacteriales bacterium Tduv]
MIVKTGVIVEASIKVGPFASKGSSYLCSEGSEGRGKKANQ